jgi:hypothetical protein
MLTGCYDKRSNVFRSRTDAALEPPMPQATPTDWIDHEGGPCPIDPNARVEVTFEDGTESATIATAEFWSRGPCPSNWITRNGIHGIVAYRVVSA